MSYAALILDQRASRSLPDLVEQWIRSATGDATLSFALAFERTRGDEMEALISDSATLAEVARRALESGEWWVAIGVGEVDEPLPRSVRESRGRALELGRVAIESAKEQRSPDLRVIADNEDAGARLEDALIVLNGIYARRAPGAAEVAALRREGLNGEEIASRLGITRQAANKHLRAGGWREEEAAERLARHFSEVLLG